MPYRNDQLVGCLPDDMQGDLDDLIADPNQPLQFNSLIVSNNNQFIVGSQLQSNQITNSSNQYEVGQNTNFNTQSNNQCLVDNQNSLSNFSNFQTTDFNKNQFKLDQLPTTSFSSNLDLFDIDDELEFNHLKDLENLVDTTQITIDNLDNVSLQPSEKQLTQQQLGLQQLNQQKLSLQQQLSPQRQLNSQHLTQGQLTQPQINHHQQPNQSAQFLISPTHPTFDSITFTDNTTSVQINKPPSLSPTNIQINSSNDNNNLDSSLNNFLGGVNSTQINSSSCNNFFGKLTTNPFDNNSSSSNFSSQLSNSSPTNQIPASYCDLQSFNNNPNNNSNNLPTTNQIKNTIFNQQDQAFCSQSIRQDNCDPSSIMLKSDTLNNPTLLSSNLNCFVNQKNLLNQTNQLNNQLVNSNQLLVNQNNFTNSSNIHSTIQSNILSSLPSNQQTMITNSSNPIKHLNSSQFKTSPVYNNLSKIRSPSNEWLNTIANQVSSDMKRCGICVIDNFLSSSFCDTVLTEVVEMYSDGCFKDGLLVGNKQSGNKNIRGDKIHWVEGTEPNCQNIGYLMRTLDQILIRFSSLNTDGCTSILNRTKAMIACYPANGTKYVKHVDNPNEDGRYITCIYYLNKNWVSSRDGGTLRIFPKGLPYVANIEPLFDRVIFFWSDRRNPHEVMPAYSIRFAITLWYFNSKERKEYIKRIQQQQQQNLEISQIISDD